MKQPLFQQMQGLFHALHQQGHGTRRDPLDQDRWKQLRQRFGRSRECALQSGTYPPARARETVEQVELATLKYVWWWNNERLHAELDMRTRAEVEAAYYANAGPVPGLTQ